MRRENEEYDLKGGERCGGAVGTHYRGCCEMKAFGVRSEAV